MSRALILRLLVPLALTACGSPGPSSDAVGPGGVAAERRVGLETQVACRDRANEMYERRERTAIYAANSSMNTPYSANYQPDIPSRELSSQFAYERTRAECERNAGNGNTDTVVPNMTPPAAKGR